MTALADPSLRQLFLDARTHNAWLDKPVTDETLHQLYDLVSLGPTSANSNPFRVVFVKSVAGKEKLKPALSPGNVDKTMAAPATAIVAWDTDFAEQMPKLFPMRDMKTAAFPMNVMVVRRSFLQQNRELVKRYQQAYAEATYQLLNSKEKATAVLSKWLQQKNPKAIDEASGCRR